MYIVFDIGGTNTRIAKSLKGNSLDVVETHPTPKSYQDGLKLITQEAQKLSSNQPISKIVIGVAGAFNQAQDAFVHNGNLKDWSNHKLGQEVTKTLNCPVILKNDVALAALAEAKTGAGKDFQSILYYSIGTGVGGAWVQNQQLSNISYSFEPGHQIINIEQNQNLEELISGMHVDKNSKRSIADIPDHELWQKIKQPLAIGLFNSLLHWPSQAVILGGGVVNHSKFPLDELSQELNNYLSHILDTPIIKQSEHGDMSGLHGALELLT